jgi:hypothetical protein
MRLALDAPIGYRHGGEARSNVEKHEVRVAVTASGGDVYLLPVEVTCIYLGRSARSPKSVEVFFPSFFVAFSGVSRPGEFKNTGEGLFFF